MISKFETNQIKQLSRSFIKPHNLYVFVLLILVASCDSKSNFENRTELEIFESAKSSSVFVIENQYFNIRSSHDNYCLSHDKQTLYDSTINENYHRKTIKSYNIEFDTIEVSNSLSGIGYNQFYFLYDVRIVKNQYLLSLYYNFDSIKGTYKLEITNEEKLLLNSLLVNLVMKSRNNYFPYMGDFEKNIAYTIPAIFIRLKINSKSIEYYGCSNNNELSLIDELIIILNKKHFDINKKISESLILSDIRKKANNYFLIDKMTGCIVEDFDLNKPPLPE